MTDWRNAHSRMCGHVRACPALARTSCAGFYGAGVPMIKNRSATSIALALLAAVFLNLSGASPARADRCDDLAAQLKNQIDGLSVGKTAANVIYLSHPQAKELSLGCSGRSYSNQLFAKARQPQADAGVSRSRGQWRRHHLHVAEGRHAERRHPLHQADGPDPWRRRLDALPPARHALRQDQDRSLDRDLAQHGRIGSAAFPDRSDFRQTGAPRSPSGGNGADRAPFNDSDSWGVGSPLVTVRVQSPKGFCP